MNTYWNDLKEEFRNFSFKIQHFTLLRRFFHFSFRTRSFKFPIIFLTISISCVASKTINPNFYLYFSIHTTKKVNMKPWKIHTCITFTVTKTISYITKSVVNVNNLKDKQYNHVLRIHSSFLAFFMVEIESREIKQHKYSNS